MEPRQVGAVLLVYLTACASMPRGAPASEGETRAAHYEQREWVVEPAEPVKVDAEAFARAMRGVARGVRASEQPRQTAQWLMEGGLEAGLVAEAERGRVVRLMPLEEIPAKDPMGDRLQTEARRIAERWSPASLSGEERGAMTEARRQGKFLEANLWERMARGKWVEGRLRDSFRELRWSPKGVDATDPATGYRLNDKGALYFLGHNLTLRRCTLSLQVPRERLHINKAVLIDCDIDSKRVLKNFRWEGAHLKECRFKGHFIGNDFGDLPHSPGEGSIEGCDFTEARLDACRFIGCDVTTLRFPPWPCFTLFDTYRRHQELSALPWPGDIGPIVVQGFSEDFPTTVAVTYFAPDLARRRGTTPRPSAPCWRPSTACATEARKKENGPASSGD